MDQIVPFEPIEKLKLKIRDKNTHQEGNEEEIMTSLKKIEREELKMEAIVGTHVHDVVYHWIHNIPVIETNSGAEYFHVIYLPFQVNTDGSVTL